MILIGIFLMLLRSMVRRVIRRLALTLLVLRRRLTLRRCRVRHKQFSHRNSKLFAYWLTYGGPPPSHTLSLNMLLPLLTRNSSLLQVALWGTCRVREYARTLLADPPTWKHLTPTFCLVSRLPRRLMTLGEHCIPTPSLPIREFLNWSTRPRSRNRNVTTNKLAKTFMAHTLEFSVTFILVAV